MLFPVVIRINRLFKELIINLSTSTDKNLESNFSKFLIFDFSVLFLHNFGDVNLWGILRFKGYVFQQTILKKFCNLAYIDKDLKVFTWGSVQVTEHPTYSFLL